MEIYGYSIIGLLITIAILVTIHEFGHFWVARMLGVKVLKFSVGFGKPIYSWQRTKDSTEYILAMIPLGGYVKMLDEREGDVDPGQIKQAFNNQSLLTRSAIVAAGPAFNFFFAIVAMWFVFMTGIADMQTLIGHVVPDSIADKTGFQVGDSLIEIDDKPVQTWNQHQLYLITQAFKGKRVEVVVEDESGGRRQLGIDFGKIDQRRVSDSILSVGIGILPAFPAAILAQIMPDSPAEQSGLLMGDRVISIDDVVVASWRDLVKIIAANPGRLLHMGIERDGQHLEIMITPKTNAGETGDFGSIGVYVPSFRSQTLQFGVFPAFKHSLIYNWQLTEVTIRSIWRMLTARMSSKNLSGPLTIAQAAGRTIQSGSSYFVRLLVIISLSLGLINLLPIPMLDGGHLFFFLIEFIKGSPLSEKVMQYGQQIGMVLLLLLMSLAFYNDIVRLVFR